MPPYLPYKRYSNGSIYGRGANDAKSCVAAQITAVLSLHRRALLPPSAVTLLFVVGEETAGDGMQAASRLNRTYSTVIFGEPTENNLVCGHKGLLTLQIRVRGKAAHSGYPWLGLSATEALTEALKVLLALRPSLPKSAKFGASTVNIGTIRGGVAGNVVAESAEAAVAIRLAGGPPSLTTALINDALEPLQEWVGMKGGSLEVVYTNDAYGPVDIDCDVDGFDTTTVNYGTDIPNLHSKYEKRYLYGPGSILVAHSDHEFVTIKDLELAVDKYEVLIRRSL